MKMLDRFGRATTDFFEYAGGLTLLAAESTGFIVKLRIRFIETISQCYLLGMQSWIIVILTSLFTGMVISLESAQQAVQFGVSSLVGGAVAYASVRELGPMLTGVVVAGRVGAAIAAELGSMVVTEQIEALRSMGSAARAFPGGAAPVGAARDAAAAHRLRRRRLDLGRRVDRPDVRAHLVRYVHFVGSADDRLRRRHQRAAEGHRLCRDYRAGRRVSRA